jgi:fermentation-respiration switch protein FrsA (DUF1100 family)
VPAAELTPRGPSAARRWIIKVVRLAGLVVLAYLGVVVVLLFLENRLLFHPLTAAQEWLAPPNGGVADVYFRSPDGNRIHAWWCPTPGWTPDRGAVLYCHGNAGNLSHRAQSVLNWQKQLDLAVLIFDYPGYGCSDGKPSEAGCYAAAQAAYTWLTDRKHVAAEQIILYGGSLGGGVAVQLATCHPHRALVLVRTFTSIPDAAQHVYPWLPARWLVRNKFENLAKIGRCTRPVFVAHGTADRLVPFEHGQRLYDAANEPKRFFTMPGADHGDPLTSDFFVSLAEFLNQTSARASQPDAAALSPN